MENSDGNVETIEWALLPPPTQSSSLVPLYLRNGLTSADSAVVREALQVTQLRSHCLSDPPSATAKDAARFLSYVAYETEGLGHHHHVGSALIPSQPIILMSVRSMCATHSVRVAARSLFSTISGSSSSPFVTFGTFLKFVASCIKCFTCGLLSDLFCESIARGEWRGARSHSSAVAAAQENGIPYPTFLWQTVHIALLFVSNGNAFATPIEGNVLHAYGVMQHCAVTGAPMVQLSPSRSSPHISYRAEERLSKKEDGPCFLASRGDGLVSCLPGGFLPPTRPSHVSSDVPQPPPSAAFASSGRNLPTLSLVHRQIDTFVTPRDMSDAAVGRRIMSMVAAPPPRPYSTAVEPQTLRLRRALHRHEAYPMIEQSDAALNSPRLITTASSSASILVTRQVGGPHSREQQCRIRGGFRDVKRHRGSRWRCIEMNMFSRGLGSKPGDVVDVVVERGGFLLSSETPREPPVATQLAASSGA